jgi:phosphoglycolate phosphatase-like HAD superfamily hydrolase
MSSSSHGRLALDLDGTLTDPAPRQLAALEAVLERHAEAGPVDLGRFWADKRGGLSTGAALEELGVAPALAAELAADWGAAVEDVAWLELDRLLPGVAEALEALAAGGERPVILTARRHPDRVREQVAALGLLAWCGGVRVVSPAAAAEQKAAELTALGARGFVGDTESDARAAELAGCEFAAVGGGQRSPEFLRARGLAVFDSLAAALAGLDRG